MIPKIIHYCWFGHNPLPPLAQKCIASWRKFLPDYEIKEWNEENFDVNQIPYTEQAYRNKKYAFVSDYARLKILHEYGGIYFDTDVEIIKPMNDILERGAFMGLEQDISEGLAINPGLGLACSPRTKTINKILASYSKRQFELEDGKLNLKTIVEYTSEIIQQETIQNENDFLKVSDFFIYPKEYFCPKESEYGKTIVSDKTRSIHHYAATWVSKKQKFANVLIRVFGKKLVLSIWNFFKNSKCY